MADPHPNCTEGHVCQKPSGQSCIETGCDEPAGTLWGPLWCPEHDYKRLASISDFLASLNAGGASDG
jgi:hypothetical protein